MSDQFSQESLVFKGVGELLKESWRLYLAKIRTLLGIMAVPVGFSVFISLAAPFLLFGEWPLVYLLFSLISFFLQLLAIPALLYCLKDNVGFQDSYQKGLKMFIPFVWVYFSTSLVIVAGFLLLIVPGILFLIWFSLVFYVLIFEEKKGTKALARSQQLVSGQWWGVFWRFLALFLIMIAFLFVFSFFFKFLAELAGVFVSAEAINQVENIISHFFSLLITPFGFIYGILIYKNLLRFEKDKQVL